MNEEEKLNPVSNSAQEKSAPAQQQSIEEVHDILDNYDGFEELLAPMADNLKLFAPDAKGKKRRFLQDEDTVEERQELLDRLNAFVNYLDKPEVTSHKQIRSAAQEKLDSNEQLINENLETILKDARDLERTYREIELFFRNAAPHKVKNLSLLNVHPDNSVDPDSNLVYKEIEQMITRESQRVDQKKAFSLLVIPNLWKSKQPKMLIERYAKLAGIARMSFLTDFANCDSAADVEDERANKKWQGVNGSELYHSKLMLFANHLMLRGQHKGLNEEGELRGSVAMAVAGKMYAEKISQPIMGEKHGSISGIEGLAFHTDQESVGDLSELGLNATMNAYEKDMIYECCTAFDGKEYPLKRYAVVRTFDYVNRVLRHYLGKVTGQQLDRKKANGVRDTIQEFLDDLKEQKIINGGEVSKFEWDSKVPDRINVDINIIPLWAVRTFVYKLEAAKGKSSTSDPEVKD